MLVSKYESRKGENDFSRFRLFFLFKTRHWRKDSIGFQLIIEYLVILEEAFQFDLGCLR